MVRKPLAECKTQDSFMRLQSHKRFIVNYNKYFSISA